MHSNRRLLSLAAGLLALVLVSLLATACGNQPLLTGVAIATPVFSPNGSGENDVNEISYTLSRDARVSVEVIDGAGKHYPLAESLERVAGSYVVKLTGSVPIADDRLERRLLPDGRYTFRIEAVAPGGTTEAETGEFAIAGGDQEPLVIADLTTDKPVISPNGDAVDDEATIAYALSKQAEVSIYAINAKGEKTILEAPTKRSPGPATHHWNGTFGQRVMPDGDYEVHVRAADKAGNVTDVSQRITVAGGGKPLIEITSVEFSPNVVPVGGYLNVTVRVKNNGTVAVKTLGPAPGTEYATDMTFNYWTEKRRDGTEVVKYYERPGTWRVAVGWNLAGRPYPVRWAFMSPTSIDADGTEHYPMLEPGQEVTIQGRIKIQYNETEELYFWAGIEQGGIGFPGGDRGLKRIRVSY